VFDPGDVRSASRVGDHVDLQAHGRPLPYPTELTVDTFNLFLALGEERGEIRTALHGAADLGAI
jgi:hypothetical protein